MAVSILMDDLTWRLLEYSTEYYVQLLFGAVIRITGAQIC